MKKNLKIQIVKTLKTLKLNEIISMDSTNPGERYLVSTFQILRTINRQKAVNFFSEYLQLLQRKNVPIFDYRLAQLLYSRWLVLPEIIKELLYFSKRLGSNCLDDTFWHQIIYKANYGLAGSSSIRAKFYLISELVKRGIVTKSDHKLILIGAIFNVQCPSHIDELEKVKFEQAVAQQYWSLLHWVELIDRKCTNPKMKEVLSARMINHHFNKNKITDKIKPQFNRFIGVLSEIMRFDFMLTYNGWELQRIYEIYKVRPDLFSELWVDPVAEKHKNILETIFQKFVVSDFFLSNFFQLNKREEVWFRQILLGKNIRELRIIPMVFTRKAAHIFRTIKTDEELSLKQGLIYSQLRANGVSCKYAQSVAANVRNIKRAQFWVKLMTKYSERQLNFKKIPAVMDYIAHKTFVQKFEIAWKKKSVKNVVKESKEWHEEVVIVKAFKYRNYSFKKSGIKKFLTKREGENHMIHQLLSSKELFIEGKKLHHCVYSYNYYCIGGSSQIYSLRSRTEDGWEPKITIEVRDGQIYQALGNFNQQPTEDERKVIQHWVRKNRLGRKHKKQVVRGQ
jgi:hypothetical protein